ncbi:RyR domain-containing protein [Methanobrevibacter sp.]|uniref:RyR domain-containing protein n=1 Tax=Methanobrevibacter sp. TaxID=66852 RepID=UPI00386D04DD
MAQESTQVENRNRDSNLSHYITNFFDMVELYDDKIEFKDNHGKTHFHDYKGLLKASIDVFLEYESSYTAYEVYETFLMIYQITPEDKSEVDENSPKILISEPNNLLDLVNIMRKYEKNTGDLIDRQRDHFIHSVNVFILGLAIYAQNENYRRFFKNYIVGNKNYTKYFRDKKNNNEFSHEEFLYRWGIAALFHDIGYPFEIIGKQLNKVIDETVESISVSYDVKANIDFRDFNEFNSIVKYYPYDYADNFRNTYGRTKILDLFKPTDIMAHKIALDFNLNDNEFKQLVKHLNGFVKDMTANGFIDHGYFSAILLLNSYGKLIQKYANKNNDFFFYPIVDSATAILLHNYYNKTLQDEDKPFNLGKLDPEDSPISYLLILCDELQEWNRRPYGILDKQKNHVNDFEVEISDKYFNVTYILKNGSMGLGFEEDKEKFIKDVLNIRKVFSRSLTINPEVVLDDVQREILMDNIQSPDVLLRNIERLAIEVNEQYNQSLKQQLEQAKKDNDDENIKKYEEKIARACDFEDLPASLKMSNIRQAKSIPKKLSMIGCEIAHKTEEEMADTKDWEVKVKEFEDKIEDNRPPIEKEEESFEDFKKRQELLERDGKIVRVIRFSSDDIDDLAIYEHRDWCRERRGTGWIHDEDNDDRINKVNPNLVKWEELDEPTKQFDRDAISNIPKLLDKIGLKVIRSRLRSLTYKMNQFYETGKLDSNSSGEEDFKSLDKHIQFSNLKQADHLVKILKHKGYELVSINDSGDPIDGFSKDEINHFAKMMHESWYKLKLNLDQTTSKNFVEWDKLREEVKEDNRNTFRYLPEMCKDEYVGLKIVKNE